MTTCALRILSGMHAQAIVLLADRASWSIGRDERSDVLLLDEDIHATQARLLWQAELASGQLVADADGVEVFDCPLPAGHKAELALGSRLRVGSVLCDVVAVDGTDALGVPKVRDANAVEEHAARMLFLRHAHWKRYALLRLRETARPRFVLPLVGALTASAAMAAIVLSKPDLATEYREESTTEIARTYPNVTHRLDPVTGYMTYTGYVDDQHQLGALRQLALKANYGSVIMNVLPMDVLALNVEENLQRHYRDPRVRVKGPGKVEVDVLSSDAIKDLEGWNFQAIEAQMRNSLPELKDIAIKLREPPLDEVRIPLERLGYSVISSSAGEAIVVNQRGDRLFAGALVNEGHVDAISLCQVKLKSIADAAVFDAYVSKEKQHVCP
ncbi:MAG TPA: hypothetical protein VME63_17875 [Dyella sp.]|uniref:hypothetical protein n=1 Tax=Dyella sp. TaxID=1869338 RepID=UPI002D0F09C0|nr:hypothetical protein [Dyella sp.]HTV87269.1 hypothetical protein [Dyella sp.]